MKGVMFVERGRAEVIEEPKPVCAPDTMLLKTLLSGISNGTERSFLVGGNYGGYWPSRIAYQLVSEVIECGAEITRFQVGDVVYTGTFPGHVEYHLARESDLIVKLPEGLDPLEAAMLGVASVSFHDARRAQVRVVDNVLVLGAGLIGQFAAQAARVMGARVTVAGHHEDRLQLARELGADEVFLNDTPEGLAALERGKPYSVIFECSGGEVMDQVIGRGREEGLIGRRSHARLVMVAGRFEVRYQFNAAGRTEVDILHTQHFDQEDLEQVARLMARGDIRARPLIRDVVPLSEAVRVYDTLRDHPRQLLGTVFRVGGRD
jgi:2-desacetyl-2-hydroxyethyl bacteriochlorophyllide A dehydrogenase